MNQMKFLYITLFGHMAKRLVKITLGHGVMGELKQENTEHQKLQWINI